MNYLINFYNSTDEIDSILHSKTSNITPLLSKGIDERLMAGDYITIYNPQTDSFIAGTVYKVRFSDYAGSFVFYAVPSI